jgi:hypothetical protein
MRFLLRPYYQWKYRRAVKRHATAFHDRNAAQARGDTREVGRLSKIVTATLSELLRLERAAKA